MFEINKKHLFLIVISILSIPLVVSFLLKSRVFSFSLGNVESWIGFWGGYLGNLLGIIGLYLATNYQIYNQSILMKQELESSDKNEKKRIFTEIILNKLEDYLSQLRVVEKTLFNFNLKLESETEELNDDDLDIFMSDIQDLKKFNAYLNIKGLDSSRLESINENSKELIRISGGIDQYVQEQAIYILMNKIDDIIHEESIIINEYIAKKIKDNLEN